MSAKSDKGIKSESQLTSQALAFHQSKSFLLVNGEFAEALSVLLLCAPSNRQRPFSYHTKIADFDFFRVLSVFFRGKKLA